MRKLFSGWLFVLADTFRILALKLRPKTSGFIAPMNQVTGLEGHYCDMNVVISGNTGAEVLSSAAGALSLWAAANPELQAWIVRHPRYVFGIKFQLETVAVPAHKLLDLPTVGPEFAVELAKLQQPGVLH